MPVRKLSWRAKPQLLDLAAVGGGAVIGGAAVMLGFPAVIAVGSAAATWGALRFLAFKPLDPANTVVADGLYETDIAAILDDGCRRVEEIRKIAGSIGNPAVRQQVLDICVALDRIFEHFEEDPSDVPLAQRFLTVYLERTRSIIQRYVEYQPLTSAKAEETRNKVEMELLPTLRKLCDEQYDRFLDDDLANYDTDVEVLKKSIRLENL
jgi:5-bromo-4-chloroindolyl phosphate hydrolysis protein